MNDIPVIAIDGTAASGKGTLARRLAAHLGYAYLDTGLLYRAVAWMLIVAGIPIEDQVAAIKAAQILDPDLLDNPSLRGSAAGRGASVVGAVPDVRKALHDFQRGFPVRAGKPGAILDGRDIGTVIFPDAKLKFFVDADQAIRAERRYKELLGKGEDVTLDSVLADMKARDARDSSRSFRPMKAAPDAIHIDTGTLNVDEVFKKALACL